MHRLDDALQTLILPRDLEAQEDLEESIDTYCQLPSHGCVSQQTCAICLETLAKPVQDGDVDFGFNDEVLEISGCHHSFHQTCLARWFEVRRSCPECLYSCGPVFGFGPRVGKMIWSSDEGLLPGHLDAKGTLVLSFQFPDGVTEEGQKYSGRSVVAYLPENAIGLQILELFKVAFKRRLLFSLGVSLTIGAYWPTFNVHMKTSRSGGIASHGYPDASYMERVLDELAQNGVRIGQDRFAQSGNELTHPEEFVIEQPAVSQAELVVVTDLDPDLAAMRVCEVPQRAVTCVRDGQCLLCGVLVPHDQCRAHAATHSHTGCSRSLSKVSFGTDCSTTIGPESEATTSSCGNMMNLVPCDECHALVPFDDFLAHVATHRLSYTTCASCGLDILVGESFRQDQDELCLPCYQDSMLTPVSLAMQMVEMVRCASEEIDLPLVGRWHVADVCNFDLVVGFVNEFFSHYASERKSIELVYHWTHEKNIDAIVNNNLRVPGEMNVDGSTITVANGDKYGRGIYAATDIGYGRRYGQGAPGALLCLALPGHTLEGRKRIDALLPSGCLPDSIADGSVRVYRSSAQLLPLFITDETHDHHVREAALNASAFLMKQAAQTP